MIQGSKRTEPRNHYTTAPLVITRVTWMTSPWRLIPASAIKNTSKNRRCNQTDLIMRSSLTNRWTATLFDDRLNLSKTQTLKWWWPLNKRELEACKSPGCNPNGLQHGTLWPNRRWHSTLTDSGCPLVSMIPIDSEGILRWDQCHWKLYKIIVRTIYRTSKSDSICGPGVSFGEVRFWNPRWSRSQVGHGLLLGVDVLAPPPWLLRLPQVLAGPLHCS
jgi:hypothetical protein